MNIKYKFSILLLSCLLITSLCADPPKRVQPDHFKNSAASDSDSDVSAAQEPTTRQKLGEFLETIKKEGFYNFKISEGAITFLYVEQGKNNLCYQLGIKKELYSKISAPGKPNMTVSQGIIPINLENGFFILSEEVSIELYEAVMHSKKYQPPTLNQTDSKEDNQLNIGAPLLMEGDATDSFDDDFGFKDKEEPVKKAPEKFIIPALTPKSGVTWHDAMTFCRRLEIKIQGYLNKEYNAKDHVKVIVRLPTEIEWECAARGKNSNTLFPWGDNIDLSEDDLKDINKVDKWFQENDRRIVVSEKREQPLVFKDFCSSVGEWCLDYWEPAMIMEYAEPENVESISYYTYSNEKNNYEPAYKVFYKSGKEKTIAKIKHYLDDQKKNSNGRYPNTPRCYRGGCNGSPIEKRYACLRYHTMTDNANENLGFRPVVIFVKLK